MARRPRAERKQRKPRSERKPREIAGRGSVIVSIFRNTMSDMQGASSHQLNREPDGTSEIDPNRMTRNETLVGSGNIVQDIRAYEKGVSIRGHKRDTVSPYLSLVLSASPEFFRPDGGPPGSETDTPEKAERLKAWKATTLSWAKATFGDDMVSAVYNGDETTPHMHLAMVPTYQRKVKIKPRRLKGEDPDDHAARVEEWEISAPTIKTRSWASNTVMGAEDSADRLRRSYADAMKPLGLHYALASYTPSNPDSPADHREWRDAERVQTVAERAEAKRLRDEASTRNIRSSAVMEAIAALAVEMDNNTIYYDERGQLQVSDKESIKKGLPDITKTLRGVARAATELQAEQAEVARDRVALSQEREALEVERAQLTAERKLLEDETAKVQGFLKKLRKAMAGVRMLAKRWKLTEDPAFDAEYQEVKTIGDEVAAELSPIAEQPSEQSDRLGF